MAKQLFRKVALERLSSPEQLDQLITITTPLGWVALLAIILLLLIAIVWGIYGSVATQVYGQGIILRKEGIVAIQAQFSGKITKINIELNDIVEEGQIVARLQQDELLEQLRKAQMNLENLEQSFAEKKKISQEQSSIQLKKLKQDELNQKQHIKNLEIQLTAQHALKEQREKIKEGRQKLVNDGIMNRNSILEVENEIVKIEQSINTLKVEIENVKNQLNNIALEIKQVESTETLDELTYSQRVEDAKLEIMNLQNKFAETSQVVSPVRGRVLELSVKAGDLVGAGNPMILIERIAGRTELEVVTYFSPLTGKQVKKGMNVQIAPSTIKREEYGYMKGYITMVDKFPSTYSAVMQTLQNDTLARMMTAQYAPIKVTATLIPDDNTESGYQWSSGKGPPIEIDSGTMCMVGVMVKEQAPITLVVPFLKQYILGEGQ